MIEIKVAILDDEKIHIEMMRKIVENYKTMAKIKVDEYLNSYDMLESKIEYDILLVDMELESVDEGLKTVIEYRKQGRKGLLIFVTSHEELVLEGFRVSAFRFVYKAKLDNDLRKAIKEAINWIMDNCSINVTIINKGKIDVLLKNILYFETEKRNLNMHLLNKELLISITLREVDERLRNKGFVKVHESYIVNLKHVANVDNNKVIMKNGESIRVTRTYIEDVKKKFWNMKINEMEGK